MRTPGSGGFGAPAERQAAEIGRDLLDGYVSGDAVRRDYGIAEPEALREAARERDQ
jgi:N-methylhydantoinase B